MLTEVEGKELIYSSNETENPRLPFSCVVKERCSDPRLKYPTYVISVIKYEDPVFGKEFAVTIPYKISGIRYPDQYIPAHAYKSLEDILAEPAQGTLVKEIGMLTA